MKITYETLLYNLIRSTLLVVLVNMNAGLDLGVIDMLMYIATVIVITGFMELLLGSNRFSHSLNGGIGGCIFLLGSMVFLSISIPLNSLLSLITFMFLYIFSIVFTSWGMN